MISEIFIKQWRNSVKWQTLAQIEQDLVISRAIVDLYNEPHIRDSLVFRGGTALNKLFLKPSARYSEDLDFVKKIPGPIGKTIDAIRALLKPWLGDPNWKISENSAKLIYRYETIDKLPAKLKIEINTIENFHVLPIKKEVFQVESKWFNGSAEVITYEIDELMATKLRALYQRRKGRDLFDLWYVDEQGLVNVDRVVDIFSKYCMYNEIYISKEEFIKNLELKRNNKNFQVDMDMLLPHEINWNFDKAYQHVIENIINRLP